MTNGGTGVIFVCVYNKKNLQSLWIEIDKHKLNIKIFQRQICYDRGHGCKQISDRKLSQFIGFSLVAFFISTTYLPLKLKYTLVLSFLYSFIVYIVNIVANRHTYTFVKWNKAKNSFVLNHCRDKCFKKSIQQTYLIITLYPNYLFLLSSHYKLSNYETCFYNSQLKFLKHLSISHRN